MPQIAKPVNIEYFQKLIKHYFLEHGLISDIEEEYTTRRLVEIVRDETIRKVVGIFHEETGIYEGETKDLQDCPTEEAMLKILRARYPDPNAELKRRLCSELRLKSLNYYRDAEGMDEKAYANAVRALHEKYLSANTYGGTHTLNDLDKFLTGSAPAEYKSLNKILVEGVERTWFKGFIIVRVCKNGRLDIAVKNSPEKKAKEKELIDFFVKQEVHRFKNYRKDRMVS